MQRIRLPSQTDLDAFRQACRELVGTGIAPEQVVWEVAHAISTDLFAEQDRADALVQATAPVTLRVPPAFVSLCEKVILHRSPDRFALLYRMLWRMQLDARLRADPLDADWMRLEQMAKAVRRDQHKMKAFVRFRRIDPDDGTAADPMHVAWFEPEHYIVAATAPFFMRRFAQMRWAILTPLLCVRWDGEALAVGPGVGRDQAPAADAGEKLWLTYYRHIFNPARLKVKMMQKEMPKRYWKNLPEAVLIDELTREAPERTAGMIAQAASEPIKRRPRIELSVE